MIIYFVQDELWSFKSLLSLNIWGGGAGLGKTAVHGIPLRIWWEQSLYPEKHTILQTSLGGSDPETRLRTPTLNKYFAW